MKLLLLLVCVSIVSCSTGVSPDRNDHDDQFMQIYFHYNFQEELDTFKGTYQKDLVIDGTVKTTMWLTTREQEIILTKLENIRYFSFPDTLYRQPGVWQSPDGGPQVLRIKYGSLDKKIVWYDTSDPRDMERYSIESIKNLIYDIIVSKPEYKALPPTRGGYARKNSKNGKIEKELK
jgi:hypothetical protein